MSLCLTQKQALNEIFKYIWTHNNSVSVSPTVKTLAVNQYVYVAELDNFTIRESNDDWCLSLIGDQVQTTGLSLIDFLALGELTYKLNLLRSSGD